MIQLINATKYYKTQGKHKYILKNTDLTIPSDVNVGILGRNGAGKSTLLKMLAGIDFPTSGRIVSDKSFSWVMGLSKGLQPAMTGRQNVKFVCRIYGKSESEIRKTLAYVKAFSELDDYFDMPIELYSSGMKSRLAFAMSLAFDFDYLIIDEILSVGDANFKKKSRNALKKKMKECHVLMVSHSMDTLRELCDVGLVVNAGHLTYFDEIEDAIQNYNKLNKASEKNILSSDGAIFESIQDVARHYKVKPKSIQQALSRNNGSHIFLKKVFWYEKTEEPIYQKWEDVEPRQTVIASDGIIFNSPKEATFFYAERHPNLELGPQHVEACLQKDGYSEVLKITFYYLSEFQ